MSPVLSFNPAYPQRKYAVIPEQRRAGLPARVPGGVGGGIGLPTQNNLRRNTSVGGYVGPGQSGGVVQQPTPNIDRSSPLMLTMQNPFRGGLQTLNFTFRNLQFKNNIATTKYDTGGSGLVNWTTNVSDSHLDCLTPIDARVSTMTVSRGAMKNDTALYERKRFAPPGFTESATPAKPNQLYRTLSQPQQQSPVTQFLSRWVSTSTVPNTQKTLPVIPYGALSRG